MKRPGGPGVSGGEPGPGKPPVPLALLGHTRRGLSVTAGEIRLDGMDLLRLRPAGLRQVRGAAVSYVPQDPSAALNPALRIGYQLREALRVHAPGPGSVPRQSSAPSDTDARVLEVLREVHLDATP